MALEKEATLTKKEKAVMRYLYNEATKNKGICVVRPCDILSNVSYDLDFVSSELDLTMRNLELDDYFELVETDKKGEFFYLVKLHRKGLAFARDEASFKKKLKFKILITICTAALTGLVGWLVKFLLTKFT